MLEGLSVE
jgi:colicin import membrane protein